MLDIARLLELGSGPTQRALAPDQEVEVRAAAERAEAAFAQLSDAHREVLLLVVGEGLDATQAGAVLGLSSEAVRQRLRRARMELADAAAQAEAKSAARRGRSAP